MCDRWSVLHGGVAEVGSGRGNLCSLDVAEAKVSKIHDGSLDGNCGASRIAQCGAVEGPPTLTVRKMFTVGLQASRGNPCQPVAS